MQLFIVIMPLLMLIISVIIIEILVFSGLF